jgi:hypothetical protein
MCSRLNSSPILPQRDSNSIYAIHDALIVSSSTVLVKFSKALSFYYFFYNILAREIFPSHMLDWDTKLCHGKSFSTKVA